MDTSIAPHFTGSDKGFCCSVDFCTIRICTMNQWNLPQKCVTFFNSILGGGPRRWRTRAPASKSTCTATHGCLCCAMSDARWPDEPRAQPTELTNRRSRILFFELTARVCETPVEHLIQVAATCWKAATPGSLCLVHSVVLCCIPMNRRATPSD